MRIRCLDLETTGLEATDHVVEIAGWDWSNGIITFAGTSLVKPPVPIPPETSAIHHIIDEDVASASPWEKVYPAFVDDTFDAYCAHNSRFEEKFLTPKLLQGKPLIDTYRAALRLWPDAPSHSNQALRYWLKPPGLTRLVAHEAHRAGPDADVTAHLLDVILRQPKVTLPALILCAQRPALLPKVNFGMHRGKKWSEVDPGYLEWCCSQSDMDEDAIWTAKHWLARVPA